MQPLRSYTLKDKLNSQSGENKPITETQSIKCKNNSPSHQSYSIRNKKIDSGPSINTYHHSRLSFDSQINFDNNISTIRKVKTLNESKEIQFDIPLKPQQNYIKIKGQYQVLDQFQPKSSIILVPFQKKVIEYQTRQFKEIIPKTKKVVEYEQKKIIQNVPREVVKKDFIAVQKIIQYNPNLVYQKTLEFVPIKKNIKKIQYLPVQKQIIHCPKIQSLSDIMNESRAILQNQGIKINQNAVYREINFNSTHNLKNSRNESLNKSKQKYYKSDYSILLNNNNSNTVLVSQNSQKQKDSTLNPLKIENQIIFDKVIKGNKYEYTYRNIDSFIQLDMKGQNRNNLPIFKQQQSIIDDYYKDFKKIE